jgi:hypothetical protein
MKMIQESLKRRKQQNFFANITRWIGMDWYSSENPQESPWFLPQPNSRKADP